MPVDKKLLADCIAEAAGDDAEMATFLQDRYSKNDALATKFVGGFMRQSDYTQKTQKFADDRKTFETDSTTLKTQLEQARTALTAADDEKNGILKELAGHRISTAKARELMKLLQEKYQLTDEDLPGMSDLIETAKKGKVVDNTEDLDARLAAFKTELTKEIEANLTRTLVPELGSLAALPVVWGDIAYEHEQLTGKRMTAAEQHEILKLARENKQTLKDAWEQKYQIGAGAWGDGLRMQKRDEGLKKNWESEREVVEAKRRQDEALNVVTPSAPELGDGAGISRAFKTRFQQYEMDPNKPAVPQQSGVPSLEVRPGQHVRQTGDRGPSGAQRAAAKFLEQRAGKKVA
jgi:hypothetical protein